MNMMTIHATELLKSPSFQVPSSGPAHCETLQLSDRANQTQQVPLVIDAADARLEGLRQKIVLIYPCRVDVTNVSTTPAQCQHSRSICMYNTHTHIYIYIYTQYYTVYRVKNIHGTRHGTSWNHTVSHIFPWLSCLTWIDKEADSDGHYSIFISS